MYNRLKQRSLDIPHSNVSNLNPDYLQLEGFTNRSATDPTVSTMAVVDKAEQLPEDTWQEAVISFGAIFALLLTSSLALGFSAHKATEGLLHITHHINQQMLQKPGNSAP